MTTNHCQINYWETTVRVRDADTPLVIWVI